jgi:ATP-dependent DNA helicase RecG
MTPQELHALIALGEGQLIEFKPFGGGVSVTSLAETIVAFANAEGGTILIGVNDDRTIAGFSPTTDNIDRLLNAARDCCQPSVPVKLERGEVNGRTVVAIIVERSTSLHSHVDGRVILRVGSQDKRLLGDEIFKVASAKTQVSYENDAVPQASWDDLDDLIIAEYLRRREERLKERIQLDKIELLRALGLMAVHQDREVPNVAAVLLFGRRPEQFIIQSGLVVVRFAGTEPGSGPTGLPGYVRREDISGPLVQCIERGWQVVWQEMRKEARVTSLVREEIPEYPPFAIREAIVNAMAHRDWRVSGLRNQIRIFDDRIEVASAGGFPGHITAENIVHEQFSRNPKIVKVLYHWNYIEELGIGVDRMIRAMTEAGHPSPEFAANGHTVTVTLRSSLRRMTVAIPEAWKEKLNERQLQALQYIKERGSITNREYREFCNVGRTVATQELSEMLQQGVLIRKKSGRATVYMLAIQNG